MKIHTFTLQPYQIYLTIGQVRLGVLVHLVDGNGNRGYGDVAPFPALNRESFKESWNQLNLIKNAVTQTDWTLQNYMEELERLSLYPSVNFGVESALLSLLDPLPAASIQVSALLSGSPHQILEQAKLRKAEGYKVAKLKVGNLSIGDASRLIHQLKDLFLLRIDVNRAWSTEESLRFFSQFALDVFDYVEEPFQNPLELARFPHPIAIDESYPNVLSLEQMEMFPTLKALVYKPTVQGGLSGCIELKKWADERHLSFVLSGCFESDIGVVNIASLAQRLSLEAAVGIGTYHYLKSCIGPKKLTFSHDKLLINS